MTIPFSFSPEVAEARRHGTPIVALESTIITHGMPFPQNVETARAVEAEVRSHGAIPATIAIMNHRIHVGLTDAELDLLGHATDVANCHAPIWRRVLRRGAPGPRPLPPP